MMDNVVYRKQGTLHTTIGVLEGVIQFYFRRSYGRNNHATS